MKSFPQLRKIAIFPKDMAPGQGSEVFKVIVQMRDEELLEDRDFKLRALLKMRTD